MGRGGDRRNTYPVSFTLWLQLIRNRLSFERFSIDRLRRVGRKRGLQQPASRHPRVPAPHGGRDRKKERERKRVWPPGGLTLSQRQLHPVFYARLFRHAFTIAQFYPLPSSPFLRCYLNFFAVLPRISPTILHYLPPSSPSLSLSSSFLFSIYATASGLFARRIAIARRSIDRLFRAARDFIRAVIRCLIKGCLNDAGAIPREMFIYSLSRDYVGKLCLILKKF